jgi:hypothetical protein
VRRLGMIGWVAASAALCSFVLLAPATVDAAPLLCAAQPAGGLDESDVTFRSANANDCYGVVSGNIGVSGAASGWTVNTLNGGLFGGGWEAFLKDDGAVGTLNNYLGVNWTLDAPQTTGGNWTLTLQDPAPVNLPLTVDMLVVLKAGNQWASYLFNGQTFALAGSNPGTFAISFLNNGGRIPALSGMSLFLRQAATQVPEPATLTLLGLGLLAFSFHQRRKITSR